MPEYHNNNDEGGDDDDNNNNRLFNTCVYSDTNAQVHNEREIKYYKINIYDM